MITSSIDEEAFRNFERARHDALAQSYHNFFAPITALAVTLLLDAARVGPDSKLLDVATGSGVLAAVAAGRGAQVVGVDLAPNMVVLAASLHPDLEFREADVEALPFEDGVFDAVICNFGLGHFPSAERAITECVRVLASGGRLAVSWWDEPSRQRIQGLFIDALAETRASAPTSIPAGPPMFRFSADSELANLLSGAGLVEVTVTQHGSSYLVRNAESLWRGSLGSLARTSAVVISQTPEVQKRICTAFHRLAGAYASAEGLAVPISFKVAAGVRGAVHKGG